MLVLWPVFFVPIIADPKLPFIEEFSEVSKVEIIQTDYVWNSFDFVSSDLRFPWCCWKEVFEQVGMLWKGKIAERKLITFEFKTLSHPVALYTWENAVFSFGKPTSKVIMRIKWNHTYEVPNRVPGI